MLSPCQHLIVRILTHILVLRLRHWSVEAQLEGCHTTAPTPTRPFVLHHFCLTAFHHRQPTTKHNQRPLDSIYWTFGACSITTRPKNKPRCGVNLRYTAVLRLCISDHLPRCLHPIILADTLLVRRCSIPVIQNRRSGTSSMTTTWLAHLTQPKAILTQP